MRDTGLLRAPPERLCEITRSALERRLPSQVPGERDWTATDLLRATVDAVLSRAIHSAHSSIDEEPLRAVMPTARDEEQEVGL
jgi:hypothetical protein